MKPGEVVLLIDDGDADLAAAVRRELGPAGAIVQLARPDDDILEAVQDDPPAVILLATTLPVAERLDLLAALRANATFAQTPILAIVPPGESPPLRRFLELDAVDFIRAPIDGEELRFHCALALRSRATISALQAVASVDVLTGLPGRVGFMHGVDRALDRARRTGRGHVLMVLEVSGLGRVNECYGHVQGDRYVASVAGMLHRGLRGSTGEGARRGRDFLARISSTEFGILAADVEARPAVEAIVARLQAIVREVTEGNCRANVGVRVVEAGERGAPDLLRDATAALGNARREGRGHWAVYDLSMREQLQAQIELESALRGALRRQDGCGSLAVHYQPIVTLATGEVAGFEALLRWSRPGHGAVSPESFVGLAERAGFVRELGEFALEATLDLLAAWRLRWPDRRLPSIAVNASKLEVAAPGYARRVLDRLAQRGLPSHLLEIEVTESAVMHDRRAVLPVLNELRAAGIRVSMDDFGVGESSLAALRGLPIDDVKIDRSFIARLGDGRSESAVVHAIVSLAEHLGIGVVAEGVETEGQLVQLQAMDCTYGQGWHFGAAMPAEEATALVAGDRAEVAASASAA